MHAILNYMEFQSINKYTSMNSVVGNERCQLVAASSRVVRIAGKLYYTPRVHGGTHHFCERREYAFNLLLYNIIILELLCSSD